MSEPTPKHGDISGYVNGQGRWVHSVWDADKHDWIDVGYDYGYADRMAAAMRERPPADGGVS